MSSANMFAPDADAPPTCLRLTRVWPDCRKQRKDSGDWSPQLPQHVRETHSIRVREVHIHQTAFMTFRIAVETRFARAFRLAASNGVASACVECGAGKYLDTVATCVHLDTVSNAHMFHAHHEHSCASASSSGSVFRRRRPRSLTALG
jgi:hypothetical protein